MRGSIQLRIFPNLYITNIPRKKIAAKNFFNYLFLTFLVVRISVVVAASVRFLRSMEKKRSLIFIRLSRGQRRDL